MVKVLRVAVAVATKFFACALMGSSSRPYNGLSPEAQLARPRRHHRDVVCVGDEVVDGMLDQTLCTASASGPKKRRGDLHRTESLFIEIDELLSGENQRLSVTSFDSNEESRERRCGANPRATSHLKQHQRLRCHP